MRYPPLPSEASVFRGFQPLSANFVYCPNQFFDVCLPHCSLGTVRLVAYLLRRTLGWLDANGIPIQQDISVTYRELVDQAGISRGSIRKAIDEAIAGHFIVCVRAGRADGQGQPAASASYQLRWDEASPYTTDPAKFNGFYAGQGNRSPIPNALFDQVIPSETLSVAKVVGTVLRFTVGYQNQFGRREQAPLSYSFIQNYAKIGDRSTLAKALRRAAEVGYIRCVEQGCFDKDSRKRKAATYAVKWLDQASSVQTGSKTRPAPSDRFKTQTSGSSQTRPDNQFKNQTSQITVKKDTSKQQHVPTVVVDYLKGFELLRAEQFDQQVATKLAKLRTYEEIQQQISWIEHRNPQQNRIGMLRKAIEENWSRPAAFTAGRKQQQQRKRDYDQQGRRAEKGTAAAEQKKSRYDRRQALLRRWRALTPDQRRNVQQRAIKRSSSQLLRRRLSDSSALEEPPLAMLLEMQNDTSTPARKL